MHTNVYAAAHVHVNVHVYNNACAMYMLYFPAGYWEC